MTTQRQLWVERHTIVNLAFYNFFERRYFQQKPLLRGGKYTKISCYSLYESSPGKNRPDNGNGNTMYINNTTVKTSTIQWFEVRGGFLVWWYWWNCWSSLFRCGCYPNTIDVGLNPTVLRFPFTYSRPVFRRQFCTYRGFPQYTLFHSNQISKIWYLCFTCPFLTLIYLYMYLFIYRKVYSICFILSLDNWNEWTLEHICST